MLLSRALAVVLGAMLCAATVSPVVAGPCEGMSHYEYDYGECTDKSGDFNSVMEKAYDESYQDQRAMLQSSKRIVGSSGGAGRAIVLKAPNAKLLFFSGGRPSLAAALYAKTERDPTVRRKLERFYASFLPAYERDRAASGLPTHFLPAARWFFVRVAYAVYDGERTSDAESSKVLLYELEYLITRAPILVADDSTKQFVYERYAITTEAFATAYDYAQREHLGRVLKTLRLAAEKSLIADLGVDPARVKIDRIPCLIQTLPGLTCAQDLQWLRAMFR